MCKNVESQISNLMIAERPTLVAVLTIAGVDAATEENVLAAYDAAQVAAENWVPGSTTAQVDEALNAALAVIVSLKALIPAPAVALLGVVIGGIEAVIGLINANSATTTADTSAAIAHAEAQVVANVPGFKLNVFERARAAVGDTHVAANHYKHEWNSAIEVAGSKYAHYAL